MRRGKPLWYSKSVDLAVLLFGDSRARASSIEEAGVGSERPETQQKKIVLKPERRKLLEEKDHYHIIAEWEHYAVLSLMETEGFRDDFFWIAKRLGSSANIVRSVVERLIRSGLVQDSGSALVPAQEGLRTSQDIPSRALRDSHRSTLERAKKALDEVAIEERHFASSTMAIRKDRIPEAKKLVKNFLDSMAELLEDAPQMEVYEIAVQLFPVTKPINQGQES